MQTSELEYNYSVSKWFLTTMFLFAFLELLLNLTLALQTIYPNLNNLFGEYATFGRLYRLHSNTLLYGFVLSAIFASWYYMAQHLLKVSLIESKFLNFIAKFHFFSYLGVTLLSLLTLIVGITTAKSYSEFEWPLDILFFISWISWGLGIGIFIFMRREKSLYISIWYFLATFISVSILFFVNNISIPTYFITGVGDFWHSVSLFNGTSDALLQSWFTHNGVELLLTFPLIAMLYYFLPKESNLPIYSFKFATFTFWTLLFLYFFSGAHHLIYSTIPDWMQTISSLFAVLTLLPLWGIAINFLLTIRGEWQQIDTNPIIKFIIAAIIFFMFSTLENAMHSIKSVDTLIHFTQWSYLNVYTLGWLSFISIAATFHMLPRLLKKELYSKKMITIQFWIQIFALILYSSSMWLSGILQGMILRALDRYGNLAYPFIESVAILEPYNFLRVIALLLFLVGFLLFVYNFYKTLTHGHKIEKIELQNSSSITFR